MRKAAPSVGIRQTIKSKETAMAWTTPILIEICVGLEINGYLPPEI
jgi:coenzyme PQQ precursor peptide PqqA